VTRHSSGMSFLPKNPWEAPIQKNEDRLLKTTLAFETRESGMTLEPNEVRVIHALFYAILFRPVLSTLILGIIQAVA